MMFLSLHFILQSISTTDASGSSTDKSQATRPNLRPRKWKKLWSSRRSLRASSPVRSTSLPRTRRDHRSDPSLWARRKSPRRPRTRPPSIPQRSGRLWNNRPLRNVPRSWTESRQRMVKGNQARPRMTRGNQARPRMTRGNPARPRQTRGNPARPRNTRRSPPRNCFRTRVLM